MRDRHDRGMKKIPSISINPIKAFKFLKNLPYNVKKLISKIKRKK